MRVHGSAAGDCCTQMPEFDRRSTPLPELTDEDIENAIDEIRNAIRKNSK